MKWHKRGVICNHETLDLPWFRKNVMVPLPHLVESERLRLFVTFCDAANVGRIGYVDVDPDDPARILGYSKTPVLDIGRPGTFCDNGILTASLLQAADGLYLYYSGYQSCVKVPYMIFAGVAVSHDNGQSFVNLTPDTPLLDRVPGEIGTRSAPCVLAEGDAYRVWYTADSGAGWVERDDRQLPRYDLKTMAVPAPAGWPAAGGEVALALEGDDEHGIAKGTLWHEDGLLKIIYSVRSLSKGYRLGYAESRDGVHFVRKDAEVGIDVSPTGWDSEMLAFPERFVYRGRTYLFYCGNHYGMGGIGYAELL